MPVLSIVYIERFHLFSSFALFRSLLKVRFVCQQSLFNSVYFDLVRDSSPLLLHFSSTAGSGLSFNIFADETFSWLQAMVNACKRTNSLLRTLQVVGLTADPNTVLVNSPP
ncbi:unnamed protein product [Bathycoccus prasinos]